MNTNKRYIKKLWRYLQKLFKPGGDSLLLISKLLLVMLLTAIHMVASAQMPRQNSGVNGQVKHELLGQVLSAIDNSPMQGVSIRIEEENIQVKSSKDGTFKIRVNSRQGKIKFSSIGFKSQEISYTAEVSIRIKLIAEDNQLDEVEVVSTGYQTIPKERATGSFVQIDNELLNRTVSTNVLDRLEGVTSGLVFNTHAGGRSPITIRGNSTIYGNQVPLIILDNFPYEGALESINPNDIENITVLKDAAAASIWGVRAGNGVIVINTKKGANQKATINLVSNITLQQKPDIFYRPQLSSSEYIDLETSLFDKGYFWNISDGFSLVSPIVAMLQQQKEGKISSAEFAAIADKLGTYDARQDISRYTYRPGVNQQYAVAVRGGSSAHTYFLGAGLDDNKGTIYGKSDTRKTVTAKNSFKIFKNRLTLSSDIFFADLNNKQQSNPYTSARFPYDRMVDDEGNALATGKELRPDFINGLDRNKMLDWFYYPMYEREPDQVISTTDYRLNHRLEAKIIEPLSLSMDYLYQKGQQDNSRHYTLDSYYTRNLINSFTQIDRTTGEISLPVPLGDIRDVDVNTYINKAGRIQLNFDKRIKKHNILALAGYEVRDYGTESSSNRRYGYDPETGISGNNAMDFSTQYPQYYGYGSNRIPGRVQNRGQIDRNRSFYFNGSYTYSDRYTFSISARRDESNLFGVKSNQKGVPLWSLGGLWKISDEPFYRLAALPVLRIRSSYGYNGNLDKSVSAYLTTLAGTGINSFGNRYLMISNPPNPSLRWEKVGVWNIGADFETASKRITGTIEYYSKASTDLIANSPLAPQNGKLSLKGNAADMSTKGWDITLNSRNLTGGFAWETTVQLSWTKDKITAYKARQPNNFNVVTGNYINPLEGYPLYGLFSFPYLGLDNTGSPKGMLDGIESQNYSGMMTSSDVDNLIYSGSATPTFFGNLMNTFRYRAFDISFNIVFKAGHKYRRESLNYSELLTNYMQPDYSKRWQQAGDELLTNVPAMAYPFDINRENLYRYGTALIEDASSIRLKDVRLSYSKSFNTLGIRDIKLFIYSNNVGLIWKANLHGQDPDSPLIPLPRVYSFGLNANF